jgi:pepF/M3 family oligoendopeptidase
MTSASLATDPLRWKTDNIYSGLDGEDYQSGVKSFAAQLDALESLFAVHSIGRTSQLSPSAVQSGGKILEELMGKMNDLSTLAGTLDSFVYAFVTTDSYNARAAEELSKLEILFARRQKLDVKLLGWLGSAAAHLPKWISGSSLLTEHAFFLQDAALQSKYLMSEPLEDLAADLCLDGGSAFGKLQGSVTSQLKVPFTRDGKTETLPITMVRNLCYDADPAVREAAYHAELKGWDSIRTTVAACLNGVKGTAITLAKRRGRESVLHAALDDNRIDRATLDAMLGAIRDRLPMFRRYFAAKAKKLGLNRLRWWDIFAPVGKEHKTFTWQEACGFIVEKFNAFSPELGEYAATAFAQRWIDVEPRDGKRGGAFCMPVVGVEESRILMNFDGSYEQVSTLAHELGHGFHTHCQRGLPPLRRGAPSTLAETASIFCETLVANATLALSTPAQQTPILEAQLCNATQVCVDIYSRFLFESEVLAKRAEREISPDELCKIITEAQAATYGDAVDPATYHRTMWVWKPHYYSYSGNFYNFPYAFGLLFALGLYKQFQNEGAAFVPKYCALLRGTGEDYAAPLAARFGIDITTPPFWHGSLDIVEEQAARFEKLPG